MSFYIEEGHEEVHPAYGYLPNPEGEEMVKLTAGTAQTFSYSSAIKNYPLEEGSLQDMIMNFYVQKGSNREIIQSENIELSYIEVEPSFTHNIPNNATNVDTANLKAVFISNRILFDDDGGPIVKIQDHIIMKQGSISGTSVPFTASLNADITQIVVTPKYGWTPDTKYFIVAKNFTAIYNLTIPKDTLVFTTMSYVGISDKGANLLKVFPNPAVNTITITGEKGSTVQILTVTGQLLETVTNTNGTIIHPISAYPSGLYFIKSEFMGTQHIEKFLKQ
jgi:hypothetical protein